MAGTAKTGRPIKTEMPETKTDSKLKGIGVGRGDRLQLSRQSDVTVMDL